MSDDKQEIRFRNPAKALGFAQLYHVATLDPEISDGALRTYLVYIMHAQQKGNCWPSTARIANLRGKNPATISRHNAELERFGYITRQRRISKTTLTWLEDIELIPRLKALALDIAPSYCKNIITESGKNTTSVIAKMQCRRITTEEYDDDDGPTRAAASFSSLILELNDDQLEAYCCLRCNSIEMDPDQALKLAQTCDLETIRAWCCLAHSKIGPRPGGVENPAGFVWTKLKNGATAPRVAPAQMREFIKWVNDYRLHQLPHEMARARRISQPRDPTLPEDKRR